MTDEQQGGTAPAPEAAASVDAPASEETVATIAVADEPAIPETTTEPPAPTAEEAADAPPVADVVPEDEAADAPPAADPEPEDEAPAPPVRRAGPEPTTMEELLAEQDSDIKSFKHGDVVEGTVVRIDKDEILVDIGAKSEGVVSNRELFGRHGEAQPEIAIGDVVLVYVLQPESP